MILRNFSLIGNPQAVEVAVEDQILDLHNNWDFTKFTFDLTHRIAELEWKVSPIRAGSHKFGSILTINISEVKFLAICAWNDDKSWLQAAGLHGISRVVPENSEFRFRSAWAETDAFHLLFEFMNGQKIELDGDSAEIRMNSGVSF